MAGNPDRETGTTSREEADALAARILDEKIAKLFAEAKTPFGKELLEPAYHGVQTFFRAPQVLDPEGIDIAMVGIPFDGGVTSRSGAREGPRAIREQSLRVGGINHQSGIAPGVLARIADLGDVPFSNVYHLDTAIQEIATFYESIVAAGASPLSAGGDHSVSYPILTAVGKENPVGLVHFDAHCDTAPAMHGSRFHHGGPFRNAVLDGVLDPKRTIQIGIRGSSEPLWDFSYESGMRVVHVEEFYELGIRNIIQEIRKVVGTGPVYVSVDVDSMDPGFAPGTGTPECGGITPFELQQVLRGMQGMDIVGGDVVEVAPPLDSAGITSLVGATMMFEILCILSDAIANRSGMKKPMYPYSSP